MPKSDLQITHGLKSRDKTVRVPTASFEHALSNELTDVIEFIKERLQPRASS